MILELRWDKIMEDLTAMLGAGIGLLVVLVAIYCISIAVYVAYLYLRK